MTRIAFGLRLTLCVGLAAVSLVAASQGTPSRELRPIDEAASQPDFFTFRAHLQAALARHDVGSVLAVISPTIRNTFGDDNGREAFRRLWKPESPDTILWDELARVLAIGGTFEANGTFVAPYTFSRWPNDVDSFEYVAIVGSRVRVRSAPSLASSTMGSLSFAIVPLARNARPATGAQDLEWTAVTLQNGRVGYVSSRYARSPVDYRAIFARTGETWQMVTFIAGD